jgi:putative ABC transport system ATP-binding protein
MDRESAGSLIALQGVTKSYGGPSSRPVLDSISLRVDRGQFAAIMGPSGSGKTTLLNLIAGLDRPSAGFVLVGGIELTRQNEADLARFRRSHIGFVFQFFHLLNDLTALDNVLISARLAGQTRQAAHERATQLLEAFGIASKAHEYPAKLSGGERQRVAIARALINRPALLLADEPTGALDSESGAQVMRLLARLNEEGQTTLLATHDAMLAAQYAHQLITVQDGKVTVDRKALQREPKAQT